MCDFKFKVYDILENGCEVFKAEYSDPVKAIVYGRHIATNRGALASIKGKSDEVLIYTEQREDQKDHIVMKEGELGNHIAGNSTRLAVIVLEV